MDIFYIIGFIKYLSTDLTHEEIEIFLSTEWGIANNDYESWDWGYF